MGEQQRPLAVSMRSLRGPWWRWHYGNGTRWVGQVGAGAWGGDGERGMRVKRGEGGAGRGREGHGIVGMDTGVAAGIGVGMVMRRGMARGIGVGVRTNAEVPDVGADADDAAGRTRVLAWSRVRMSDRADAGGEGRLKMMWPPGRMLAWWRRRHKQG